MTDITQISGTTRVYAIIADPIHHVQTPQAMNRLFSSLGLNRVLVPFHVAPADLERVVTGLRGIQSLDGFIVTVPHKTAIAELCDSISETARLVGAVNVVTRSSDGTLHGEILDGEGFVTGLRHAGIELKGRAVYLAGAGGAANAIAFALAASGIGWLTIANRSRDKATSLVERLARAFPDLQVSIGTSDPSGYDLVVNGTSLGLREGDPLPCDVTRLSADQVVAEIIMQPAITPLLAAAQKVGCRIHEGLPMLLSQIELMAAAMASNKNESSHERV
ncbi:shikimate dehydrogenase [Pseudomonas sp. 7P_10.2_Bac1]|uniref:shikimate dehydrogenase family protein n=1 Tax=Pseudomonas sp. 7P_10.2_Bac1 TaxID=2971614 RepID=UPI0021C676BF|nr:shikimate dehydrogenase [Pseudomonas sp. 7P_10.2_Bac1]MCU1726086.1 shikimate dehydrogenase [Pseudomonas sp. 7P_10.2_Bac1]